MNIQDILIELNVPYVGPEHEHGRPGWVQVDCPWCAPGSGRYYLGIALTTGSSSCWRCGKKNTAAVLARLTGTRQRDIRARIDNAELLPKIMHKTGQLTLPGGLGPLLPGHVRYIAGRGLNVADTARLWGIQGIGNATGKWRYLRWSVFIPIYHYGEVVSWTTRSIKKDAKRRYLSAAQEQESIRHKSILYGADYAMNSVIVHEGPIDVWATGPGAVCTFGTGYTEAQLRAISKYPVRTICYDAEYEAQKHAKELADALSVYPGVTHNVTLETGKDAASADKGEIAELRRRFLE